MLKKNVIYKDLKPNNILISLDKLDNINIKLSDYCLTKGSNIFMTFKEIPLIMSPEVLNGEDDLSKSNLWNLGILIYYMYFKEYPYNGKNEVLLLKDINSDKKLKTIQNEDLNELMIKLLKNNPNQRLSWEEYFNHKFFKEDDKKKIPYFNFKCKQHPQNLHFYCQNCKLNICEYCLKGHHSHKIISFNNIGLNDNEIKQIENLFQEIENRINIFNKLKMILNNFLKK